MGDFLEGLDLNKLILKLNSTGSSVTIGLELFLDELAMVLRYILHRRDT